MHKYTYLAAAVAGRAAHSSAVAQLHLDLFEAALDVVSEVLRRLVEEGGQVGVRVLLLEVEQLLQPLFYSKNVKPLRKWNLRRILGRQGVF